MTNFLYCLTRLFVFVLITFSLYGCGSNDVYEVTDAPLLEEFVLKKSDFKLATWTYLHNGGGPRASSYKIIMTDLNGDHVPEGLVMMNTPHSHWCSAAGCTLLIFEARGRDIVLNSRIEPIRGPLFLHDTGASSWKTIVTRQDGLGQRAHYIQLENNGTGYLRNTLSAPHFEGYTPQTSNSLFY